MKKSRFSCVIVIPARYGSTRFPGKVLSDLGGRSLVWRCWQNAVKARVGKVLVATEDARVAAAVESFGGECVMTSSGLASGSDRVFEAAKNLRADVVINMQSDHPFLSPRTIRAVFGVLKDNPRADIATAVVSLDPSRLENPNIVKAAVAPDGRCLYFSRAPIPFSRNGNRPRRLEHLGIYGFRKSALRRFTSLRPSPLERSESLEQLRALENGMSIYAALVRDIPCSVDTPEDLGRARDLLAGRPADHDA